jgi:hypothetical protein
MMQSCASAGKLVSAVRMIFNHIHYLETRGACLIKTQQSLINMRVRGIVVLLPQAIRDSDALPGQREWSRPKHDVTEGIMTSVDDMRPEATLLIGLS